METTTTTQLEIKLKEKDVDNFKSAMKKITDEHKVIGFKYSNLNDDELNVIKTLSEKINTK